MTRRAQILVVDDDEKVRDLLRDVLDLRYDVTIVDSGEAALARVAEARPDVVMLDVNMPGMSGIEALRVIRERDRTIPVIMITGASEIGLAEDAFRLGAFAYLPKPFQIAYAEHLVRTALRLEPD